jgi:hypothetical protein
LHQERENIAVIGVAQRLSGSDGIDAIMTLTAGIHLYKQVDKEDYIENAKNVKGILCMVLHYGSFTSSYVKKSVSI